MTHTVTITRTPDETSDDWEYAFDGDHGPECAVWDECARKACSGMNPDYEPGYERFRHGKTHEYRDGAWFVETDRCALRYVFEHQGDDETFEGLGIGEYEVRICWDDSWWLEVGAIR